MKTVECTRGKVALVDDADFEFVSKYSWNGHILYPQARIGGRGVFMHQYLLGTIGSGFVNVCDHRNGNGYDNQRVNLRLGTQRQNVWNQRKQSRKTTSHFKGVCWLNRKKRWRARVRVDGKDISRYFNGEEGEVSAARAYDKIARLHFGDFACVNFPDEGERGALTLGTV